VARALSRAHEAGIVHRDLKPANVFLVRNADEELAKVLDFGTARVQPTGTLTGSTTPTGAIIGTPYFMSPEHISGQPVDHRTDLWAMAVMAFECLTGRRPFEARDIGQLVLQICTYPIPAPATLGPVPPGFDAWFQRATRREIDLRFQSAREQADELRRVCDDPGAVPVGAGGRIEPALTQELPPPTAPVARPARGARRAVRWVWVAAAVALAVGAAGMATTRAPRDRSLPLQASPPPPTAPPPAATNVVAPAAAAAALPATEPAVAPAATVPATRHAVTHRKQPRHVSRYQAQTPRAPARTPAAPPTTDDLRMESVLDHRR
jgi:serine/threonine-protein kinase